MRLWLLENNKALSNNPCDPACKLNPWHPWYDKAFSMVIRAETEEQARGIAHIQAGDENNELDSVPAPWKDPAYSTCVELTAEGEAGLIMREYRQA